MMLRFSGRFMAAAASQEMLRPTRSKVSFDADPPEAGKSALKSMFKPTAP
jgi:hypothetical protein